jgi:hypothetical protein
MFRPNIHPKRRLMRTLSGLILTLVLLFFSNPFSFSQHLEIIESNPDYLTVKVEFDNNYKVIDTLVNGKTYQKIISRDDYFRNPGEPWLPVYIINVGIPHLSQPKLQVLEQNKSIKKNQFIIPYPPNDPIFEEQNVELIDKNIYTKNEMFPKIAVEFDATITFRYARIIPVKFSPYQFNPVTRDLIFNRSITIRVEFSNQGNTGFTNLSDVMTDEYLSHSVINNSVAKNFVGKTSIGDSPSLQDPYWYNPNKEYSKIFVEDKGVYRVTYNELISSGAQIGSNTSISKLELFNDGLPIPIHIIDANSDQIFNSGDYFQFVGFPASPSSYCTTNIYNLSNTYWFSYQSDSTGLNYVVTPGYPNSWDTTYYSNLTTIHLEKDSLYERLGLATHGNRDYWFWDKATAIGGQSTNKFQHRFNEFPGFNLDSHYVRLKVALQGVNDNQFYQYDHKAYVSLTGQPIGEIIWAGASTALFDKTFYVSEDSINIFPSGNILEVEVRGDLNPAPADNDEIRINWAEFDYWRFNRVDGEYFNFTNNDLSGVNRYFMWEWHGPGMRVYIPSKNKYIQFIQIGTNATFIDTLNGKTEYFCASNEYYLTVDSIRTDINSDLRNLSNGADYIVITHPNFEGIANTLANLRESDFPDESISNPRIEVVDIFQIYDEFSYGLLDPKALQLFVKYAFENWQSPAPSYIVLVGDMSYDYRALFESNRLNFIPSIPFFANGYGQAASDNLIVAVSGSDLAPDLAIGRLSMETVEEGNVILNKLINYPDDPSKPWKEDILLVASGLSLEDEIQFGFNDASVALCQTYIEPEGFHCSKVFHFPSKPEHIPFQGAGPEIRREINEGTVLLNYYGHGGGFQWDLVFLEDDIYLLENNGRLPVILSVTCYTAHFDNQNVFGEIFNEVEGKGSVGFYGSSGLTYWGVGKALNNQLFDEIFKKRNYVIGKAILNSKNNVPSGGIYGTQMALLTYLGDPVLKLALPRYPDFEITSSDINLSPDSPLLGDTISVKLNIKNWGTVFPNDSVVVELFAGSADTSYTVGSTKLSSFGEKDSVYFTWIPNKGGLYNLTAKVNESAIIPEDDHTDNIATDFFIIFNISEPYTLEPIDGFSTNEAQIDFLFSDIGHYIHKDLTTFIEIDTSLNFSSPLISSGEINSSDAQIKWTSPNLPPDVYFWRARIYDGIEFGNWSPLKSFSVMNVSKNGYYAHGKILKTFGTYNINFSDSSKSLVLNTAPLPARPSNKTLLEHFLPDPQLPDTLNLTALTTDGTYLYFGDIWATASANNGKSKIYKAGTGNNGTIKGQVYGQFSSFNDSIRNTIAYHSDGNIYIPVGYSHKIVRINVSTELIDTVDIPNGLLRWDTSTPIDGFFYICSDGQYIYNLTTRDTLGNFKYTLRTLDPSNSWAQARPDMVLSGSSFTQGITSFFVHGDYIYPTEYIEANEMRRIRLSDGLFEEEWIVMVPFNTDFQSYYSWCWDWQNDDIYASVYRASGFEPKFSRFAGYYVDANGTIETEEVGPVAWWNSLEYDFYNPSSTGDFSVDLLGENSGSKIWDTLQTDIPSNLSLTGIDPDSYHNLKLNFNLVDSSFSTTQPMELRSINFDYQTLSDAYFVREDLEFEQDSLLQGYPVTMNFKSRNYGELSADSLRLDFYLNGLDTIIYTSNVNIPPDSLSNEVSYVIETDRLLFENEIRVLGDQKKREYFYFNNLIDNQFFVARDSVRPEFNITFDGIEIIDGDIISSKPEVVITLEDNSPLPIDTSYFTIVHTDSNKTKILRFADSDLDFSYTQDPVSEAIITWTPELEDGSEHTLEVLAKDASGNFFDSTSSRTKFSVFTDNDIDYVYNYPNPFKDETHFTFLLKGTEKPDQINIKIYTIAGRLIWDYNVPPSELITNFNKIRWNGRDQDGDEISNGVYFYKVIAKFPDKTKTITQKLAKVK